MLIVAHTRVKDDNLIAMSEVTDRLIGQAFQARREHRPEDAKRDLVLAVGLHRLELAWALTRLGECERDLKNPAAALEFYGEAVTIYREQGDALRLAHSVRHVGDIQRGLGRLDLAEPCYIEALDIYRGDAETPPLDLANAIRGFALLKGEVGAKAEAKSLWTEARDLYRAVGVEAGVEESSRRIGLLE